jgi:hypothetical protein
MAAVGKVTSELHQTPKLFRLETTPCRLPALRDISCSFVETEAPLTHPAIR